MTERKKEYIVDALGEIEDIYIAEAAEYVKPARTWGYWRECGVVAACIGAVVITAAAWQYLPIGHKVAMENTAAKQEMWVEEMAPETSLEKDSATAMEGIREEKAPESAVEDITKESAEAEVKQESGSNASKPVGESIKMESIAEYRSAEEILAEGHDIFLGEVIEKQVYTEGEYRYFTVITVRIEQNIRGDVKADEEYRIYLPVAATKEVVQAHSLSGDLDKLSVGSRAVFMPKKAEDSALSDAKSDYSYYADYYYEEGARYLFLETEDGVSYAEEVYDVGADGAGAVGLSDVVTYLKALLGE